MASIIARKNKDGKIVSYRIRVSRGQRGLKPWEKTITLNELPDNFSRWSGTNKEKHLQALANAYEEECKKGIIPTENKTFNDFAHDYIERGKQSGTLKESTAWRYSQLFDHINDINLNGIGYMKLKDIRSDHIDRFYVSLSKDGTNKHTGKGLSARSILIYHKFIYVVLADAEKRKLVARNEAHLATPPKEQHRDAESYDINTIRKIMQCVENEDMQWKCLVNLLITSGCRIGECTGLTWDNVDFKKNRIYIAQTMNYVKDLGLIATPPKTAKSKRYVSLPPEMMDIFKEWKIEQAKRKAESGNNTIDLKGLVFTKQDYVSPIHNESVNVFFKRFSEKYGLPHLHPHGFRHTLASQLIHNNEDIVSVSSRLGHSSPDITLRVYSHDVEDAKEQTATKISNIFFKAE